MPHEKERAGKPVVCKIVVYSGLVWAWDYRKEYPSQAEEEDQTGDGNGIDQRFKEQKRGVVQAQENGE